MNLGKEILLEIKKADHPLCAEVNGKLRSTTKFATLAELYFKGDDWSLKNDFPSAELMRKYKGGISPYGMFVDDHQEHKNVHHIAFFGESQNVLYYDGFSVGYVIIRHLSESVIHVKDNAVVYVNLLDQSKVKIDCSGSGRAVIYHYGGSYTFSGNVKVTDKTLK